MEVDIKELKRQRNELDNKVKQYYRSDIYKRIKDNEEKYVGRCYKRFDIYGVSYIKILSGLTDSTCNLMHYMKFTYPINMNFINYSMTDIFSYSFCNDILEFDYDLIDRLIMNSVEITLEEFEDTLKAFVEQLILISRDDFTISGKYFSDTYRKEINNI